MEALTLARRHANHHDVNADAQYLLETGGRDRPLLERDREDDDDRANRLAKLATALKPVPGRDGRCQKWAPIILSLA